jgi:hypothetical protein
LDKYQYTLTFALITIGVISTPGAWAAACDPGGYVSDGSSDFDSDANNDDDDDGDDEDDAWDALGDDDDDDDDSGSECGGVASRINPGRNDGSRPLYSFEGEHYTAGSEGGIGGDDADSDDGSSGDKDNANDDSARPQPQAAGSAPGSPRYPRGSVLYNVREMARFAAVRARRHVRALPFRPSAVFLRRLRKGATRYLVWLVAHQGKGEPFRSLGYRCGVTSAEVAKACNEVFLETFHV